MAVRVVRLGSPRAADEGTRIGTVRRPPRGVPKSEFAAGNWFDVWYPLLAPGPKTVKLGQLAQTPQQWQAFQKRYRSEMALPDAARTIDLLAALSHHTDFSVVTFEFRGGRSAKRGGHRQAQLAGRPLQRKVMRHH